MKESANTTKRYFSLCLIVTRFCFVFGLDFYYWHNVDEEYVYNVLNILVEVDDILLETGSWLKVMSIYFVIFLFLLTFCTWNLFQCEGKLLIPEF